MHLMMRPICAMAAALLSTVVSLSGAEAANRGFPGFQGKAFISSEEGCLSRWGGWVSNTCNRDVTVLLPVSVDNAAWYVITVYGRRTGAASVKCRPVAISPSGTTQVGQWKNFVRADGGAEFMSLGTMPVSSPGDALFADCMLGESTVIFSYGWN